MLRIGCHLSSSKGFLAMGKEAVRIEANTFQFFTRNPRGSTVKSLDEEDIADFRTYAKNYDLQPILAHAPYTLNASAQDEGLRIFARNTMADDLRRLEYLPGCYYNFHPGSHVRQGVKLGIDLIADILNKILTPTQSTIVLLETMAGKGSEIGWTFEELRLIIDKVNHKHLLGVCLDTCHVHDSGYDIVKDLDTVLQQFDDVLGLEKLKAIHLNDSMNPIGSRKDRHEKIGKGYIGLEALTSVINHPSLRRLPFYLETPNDIQGYQEEIALLKNLYQENVS